MVESLCCFLIRGFAAFICALPVKIALIVGRGMGHVAYWTNSKKRRLCYYNLKQAFGETKTPKELHALVKAFFIQFGQNIIEFLRFPILNSKNFHELIEINGIEEARKILDRGHGLLFFAMHLGNWELASALAGFLGFRYKIMVNPHKRYPKLNALLNEYRTKHGAVSLSTGMGPRDFIKALKSNHSTGIVIDQGGADGFRVPFFGRTASMSTGGVRLALKYDVPVCMVSITRLKNGRNYFKMFPEIKMINTGDLQKDIETNLRLCVKTMEDSIRSRPHEYLWTYRVWKHSSQAHLVILSDGKAGHVHQAQAVAGLVQQCLKEKNIESTVEICEIKFRNIWASRWASLVTFLMSPLIREGYIILLKPFLMPEVYARIEKIKADYVISCGSSMAGINYVLAQETGAKRIGIQRPGLMRFKCFNALILPQHDLKIGQTYKDVVITQGAPNLISPAYLSDMRQKLFERYPQVKADKCLKIGILIGGDSKNMSITFEQIRILVEQLKQFAGQQRMKLLVTSSRRTAADVEALLLKELENNALCPVLVIASKNNFTEALGGILGAADLLVVSGDSISMVSEAVTSGKPTLVFKPTFKKTFMRKRFKHEIFVDRLNEQNYVVTANVNQTGEILSQMAGKKIITRPIDDAAKIYNRLKQII
ncbi:MAG: mitochondrial fission ELM1 family protein [Candidatus Omnitrophica bacterium]|nr:mitochondrial fission ELM1 family protein [Candidatus Omnitrophota bacterium]